MDAHHGRSRRSPSTDMLRRRWERCSTVVDRCKYNKLQGVQRSFCTHFYFLQPRICLSKPTSQKKTTRADSDLSALVSHQLSRVLWLQGRCPSLFSFFPVPLSVSICSSLLSCFCIDQICLHDATVEIIFAFTSSSSSSSYHHTL